MRLTDAIDVLVDYLLASPHGDPPDPLPALAACGTIRDALRTLLVAELRQEEKEELS